MAFPGIPPFGRKQKEEFEKAALPHMDAIFRTAFGLLGNREEAQDLTQDVFLNAWRSFGRFELGTNCRAWLFKILFYRLHHHRRKLYRGRSVDNSEDLLGDVLAAEPPLPEKLSDKEILQALHNIPEQYRAVVLLTDVEELSYKEAAEMLKIPVGTVMSRLSRGRKLLRERLAGVAATWGVGKQSSAGGLQG